MLIAVSKRIGTLEGNTFLLVTGILCFLFDLVYIYCLRYVMQKEKALKAAA